MHEISRLFPDELQKWLENKINGRWHLLQEIRIRLDKPMELVFDTHAEWMRSVVIQKRDAIFILNKLTEFSLYRMEDELREGYITIEGGHRVGLAGKVNTIKGAVKAIQHITFFNIRIAKEKIGAAQPMIPYLLEEEYINTLVTGPPQTGKTTIIRDLARLIASGGENVPAKKVGIIDERSEIAGSIKGIPQHSLGMRTDVMDACPKAEGMMMMIRSMSPDVLIVDEIGSKNDVDALMEAIYTGVTVICTMHGENLEDIQSRPSLEPLWKYGVFGRIMVLDKKRVPGTPQAIYDGEFQNIFKKMGCHEDAMDWSASLHRSNHMGRV